VWFVDGGDRLTPGTMPAVLSRLAEWQPDLLLVEHARERPDGRLASGGAAVGRFAGTVQVDQRPKLLDVAPVAWNRVVHRDLLDQVVPGEVEFSHLTVLRAQRIATHARVGYVRREAMEIGQSRQLFGIFTQYERVFARLDQGRPAVEPAIRVRLFELMIQHYLGVADRVPDGLRPAFFRRTVAHYGRFLPAADYRPPRSWNGVKERFDVSALRVP
jgi:hypothetical protein